VSVLEQAAAQEQGRALVLVLALGPVKVLALPNKRQQQAPG